MRTENPFNIPVESLNKDCPDCKGEGFYFYDYNHARPCDKCCPHEAGWWTLTKNYCGYKEGEDNLCCKMCGKLHRELK